jgi:hypothetical protein
MTHNSLSRLWRLGLSLSENPRRIAPAVSLVASIVLPVAITHFGQMYSDLAPLPSMFAGAWGLIVWSFALLLCGLARNVMAPAGSTENAPGAG